MINGATAVASGTMNTSNIYEFTATSGRTDGLRWYTLLGFSADYGDAPKFIPPYGVMQEIQWCD